MVAADDTGATLPLAPQRAHLTRLMAIWRSAGWPCRDGVELDLLAAGWAGVVTSPGGHETLRLTDSGIRLLAAARQRNRRALTDHDRLAQRVAIELMNAGRIVWRELSLRARVEAVRDAARDPAADVAVHAVLDAAAGAAMDAAPDVATPGAWRLARPDVFSVRHTSVEDYLQPMVHEVKTSRADLLSDLRHAAKREAYRGLSSETHYVFPAGVATPEEVPPEFGVWLLHGPVDGGALERVRSAQHQPCKLPFAVWMALARSTPVPAEREAAQVELGAAALPADLPPADA